MRLFSITTVIVVTIFVVLFICIYSQSPSAPAPTQTTAQLPATDAQYFLRDGLRTDTRTTSIPLTDILDGGPGKDGIPAINEPQFDTVTAARTWLTDESRGILYRTNDTVRFYPYAILYWHEVVNDVVGDTPIAVTFCPLCSTAIVFDRRIDGATLQFGVSGKLYQSNFLMYDTTTESLWSQARGEAVVGTYTGTRLTLLRSNLVSFGDVARRYPRAHILSRDTGYRRNYARAPYGDYETNNRLIFPTDDFDARFAPKELFVVAPLDSNTSLGFHFANLRAARSATLTTDSATYTATVTDDGTVTITDAIGTTYPHYTTMYFSWSIHDPRTKVIWEK